MASNVATLFLDGAHVVATALASAEVAAAWDRPSVLDGQLVSGLAGHLARGAVWVVGDYLDQPTPEGPVRFRTAGEYFAAYADSVTPETDAGVRERGAAIAAVGRDALLATLDERIAGLERRLPATARDHPVAVFAGAVMPLEPYLVTRMVEQAVHLDDLARSVGGEGWPLPADHVELVIQTGLEIARRRRGRGAVLRALYRGGFAADALPVL